MERWKTPGMYVALAGCMLLFSCNCDSVVKPQPIPVTSQAPLIADGDPVTGAIGNVVSLESGWNDAVREWWWFTSQGSQVVPYDWFLYLEQADSTALFRSNANMERFRYLPQQPSDLNPDGLPVGFARDTVAGAKDWVGFTCAACHTGQLTFQDTAIRVEGAPTMADFNGFFEALIVSVDSTRRNDAKFRRFADQVLGAGYTPQQAGQLRDTLRVWGEFLTQRNNNNRPPADNPAGYARLDALNNILNQTLGQDLGINRPPNIQTADQAVSYPAIWDASNTDLVQWNGSVNNRDGGFIARNLGEVLGVFAHFNYKREQVGTRRDGTPILGEGYESSVNLTQQSWLEVWVKELWSPKWPEQYLGTFDPAKVNRGKQLYATYCTKACHALLEGEERTSPTRKITAEMWPVDFIGTSRSYGEKFIRRTTPTEEGGIESETGKLEGQPSQIITGALFPADTTGIAILTNAVAGVIARQPVQTVDAFRTGFTRVTKPGEFLPLSYRARPLNGIWATAPYLHNGSVPNLWELLLPADQRSQAFHVGNRAFDPVNVGYSTEPAPDGNSSLLDTTKPGNSNAGHEYGVTLSEADKWALIEYLKTL